MIASISPRLVTTTAVIVACGVGCGGIGNAIDNRGPRFRSLTAVWWFWGWKKTCRRRVGWVWDVELCDGESRRARGGGTTMSER